MLHAPRPNEPAPPNLIPPATVVNRLSDRIDLQAAGLCLRMPGGDLGVPGRRLIQKPVPVGVIDRLGARGDVELAEDVGDMGGGGAAADI